MVAGWLEAWQMTNSNSPPRNSLRREATGLAPIAAFLCAILVWSDVALAQSTAPFAKFIGGWAGTGQVTSSKGTVEKIRCRANYSIGANEQSVTQSLVCASDSYRIQIHTFVVADAQNVRGHWEEATRQATGQLTGTIADGRFEGTISAPAFTAEMSLAAVGRSQTIVIAPRGGDISRVSIVLSREM
jgi:hypothetical protein